MTMVDYVLEMGIAYAEHESGKAKQLLQMLSASEGSKGHDKNAKSLSKVAERIPVGFVSISGTGSELYDTVSTKVPLSNLIVDSSVSEQVKRVIDEYGKKSELVAHGLHNSKRLLLEGEPGTGKTYTASVIATELGLPLYVLRPERVISKYLGETGVKMGQAFGVIRDFQGVFMFDEFDSFGFSRSNNEGDVGEMRRCVDYLIQFMDADVSDNILICSTNMRKSIDKALFRRFDRIIHYGLPDDDCILRLLALRLGDSFDREAFLRLPDFGNARGMCHADITWVCDELLKESILDGNPITMERLADMLGFRKTMYKDVDG